MGADMIGYQTMFPQELTREEKEKLNKHLDDIETLLRTPNLAKMVAEEESANDTYLKQLNEKVQYIPHEIEGQGFHDDVDEIQYLIDEHLDLIDTGREFIEDLNINERDTSSSTYSILGRNYVSVFAGEMTWGDEPEGGGYEILKNLDKLNLLWEIEQLTIPQSKSIHFIKEK